MVDIDLTVKDFDELLSKLNLINKMSKYDRTSNHSLSVFGISVNMVTSTLDEIISNDVYEKKLYKNYDREHFVDVIETENKIKIIATLPGIKMEDVWYDVKHGMLIVEVINYGQILKKQIRCDAKPEQILLKSYSVNNSVLELVFDKV